MTHSNVCFCLPDFSGGGAEKVMMTLIEQLCPYHQVHCIALSDRGPLYARLPQNCSFINMHSTSARQAILPLSRFFRIQKPDVVVATMAYFNFVIMFALLISGHRPDRIILREANTPASTIASLPLRWLGRFLYKFFYNRADEVICNSKQIARGLSEVGVKQHLINVIPNPVDVKEVRQLAAEKVILPKFADPSLPYFVAVGRLTGQKGMDQLIHWLSLMQEKANLLIIGRGPKRAELLSQINDAQLDHRIKLIDFQNNPFPFMANANAVLLGSRWEGLPNVGLEALALGKNVAATMGCGGLVELQLDKQTKSLFIAKADDEFVAELDRLAKKRTYSKNKAFAISQLPRQFHIEAVVAQYEKAIFGR